VPNRDSSRERDDVTSLAPVEHPLHGVVIYQQGRIVYANSAYAQTLGYSPEELYAMRAGQVLELVFADDREHRSRRMQAALAGEEGALRYETRVIRKDGSLRWLDVTMAIINHGGLPALQAASVDITQRKLIEAERARLVLELESKNAELERFAYTISHDLKTPLITIRGFLGFLEKDAALHNTTRLKADIQRITEATENMQRLLDDLLALSRVGRVANPPANTPFAEIAAEAVERVAGQIRAREVQVSIHSDLPTVFVDRERVVEVVQNLVDNAVKFMGDRPNPQLEIGAAGLGENSQPVLFVRDNGIGIDPLFHDRVFGLFNRLSPEMEGTGIGLALVRRIVEHHGGRVWLESAPGKGSTFYFSLPSANPSNGPAPG